ncbi:hypothetical protein CW712_02715 [Candidatus Bathyarchaeota archaeon]|nr:MAG: hypothetical protein CW712_02715 [Candidatus Bathyarchaeota archaeon]
MIMTDTQGINVVGCYGRPEMRTPNLDKLAAQGIRFDRAYTCCPVCGPAQSIHMSPSILRHIHRFRIRAR